MLKRLGWLAGWMSLALAASTLFIGLKLRASLPVLDGQQPLPGLTLPVEVTSDRYGIPTITAQSRLDAMRALGYITARDRLFQMDLLRRQSAGRLAEIFGQAVLDSDIEHRHTGFKRVAPAIVASLPPDQREVLQAYAEGVNAFIAQMDTPPFEFLVLGYTPERWTVADSILVVLGMFQTLAGDESAERMLTIMEAVLPPEVVAFLTPDTDQYTTVLAGGPDSRRPIRPIPAEALAALRRSQGPYHKQATPRRSATDLLLGSNGWAVDQAKTTDGRAILANDMHLPFSVPNIWYRAVLRYGAVTVAGVLLPGVPTIIAGSNGFVAWGMTNSKSDVLDLVRLELNPFNLSEYRFHGGWKRFDMVPETIHVHGGMPVVVEVRHTIWGPVSPQPLMGQPVALRWTALDPQDVDLGLLAMDAVTALPEALDVINRFRGPPLHVLLADRSGHIAWTYSGRIPRRQGFDGSHSVSWADGQYRWEGYIPPQALPRVLDPAEGFLVTANQRALGKEYPDVVGHNFDYSYRAYQISARLREMERITEGDMLQLQLDTISHFYDFYQQLALSVLTDVAIAKSPLLAEARHHILRWQGRADVESPGFALLVQFREAVLVKVFDAFLAPCRERDADFSYVWRNRETPLRLLLTARLPELLPDPIGYRTWDAFLRGTLEERLQQLRRDYHVSTLEQLPWGRLNTASIRHPLAGTLLVLGRMLNMPQVALPGCTYCIRTTGSDWGASERLVVSPGRHHDAILHMPGGQSAHPLSANYDDQHSFWLQGAPLPFLPGQALHTLVLTPVVQHVARPRGVP
jgi:penicillin amidase